MWSKFSSPSLLLLLSHLLQVQAVDPPYIRCCTEFVIFSKLFLKSEDSVTTSGNHSSLGLASTLKGFSRLFSSQTCRFLINKWNEICNLTNYKQVHSLKPSGGTDMQFLYQALFTWINIVGSKPFRQKHYANVQEGLIRGFGDAAGRCVSVGFSLDCIFTFFLFL